MYSPILLDQATGEVRGDDANDMHGAEWYAAWLRESYANRVEAAPDFKVEEFRPIRKPLLLNCIDTLYGHTLSKLINAQYYIDHMPDWDVIVLIPFYLRWLVPDGVAAIWTVKLPLKQGTQWNDGLARILAERVSALGEVAPLGGVWISKGYSHAYPEDFDIERFTRIKRFPMHEWDARLDSPLITFVWREDRLWVPTQPAETVREVLKLLWQRLTTGGKRPISAPCRGMRLSRWASTCASISRSCGLRSWVLPHPAVCQRGSTISAQQTSPMRSSAHGARCTHRVISCSGCMARICCCPRHMRAR
jgi:hypothetical protein